MPQLHFYVPDDLAETIRERAARAKQPVSRYIAELVRREVGQGWPGGYFERISGKASDASLAHEIVGLPEERLPLE